MAEGDKIPRKGGPGITRSDLLVINKIDLAPHVGADLDVMRRDSLRMRGDRPFLLISLRNGDGVAELVKWVRSAIRISASDFVIPPDLQRWPLAADGAGRIGGVRLELAAGPLGARLRRLLSADAVARAAALSTSAPDQPALLYLLNPTAGLMDGDGQLIELRTEPGAARRCGRASRRRGYIRPSLASALNNGASTLPLARCLVVLPGPAIPFRGVPLLSARRGRSGRRRRAYSGATFGWRGVTLAVRRRSGFALLRCGRILSCAAQGRLVFRDHFDWRGPWDESAAAWHFGDANACGSLFHTGQVKEVPSGADEVLDGASFTTAAGDACFRWRGPSEAVTAAVVQTALHLAAKIVGSTKSWLSGPELAPCHWFSPTAHLDSMNPYVRKT